MATWLAAAVGHPGLVGTAVLAPDVSGPQAPSDQWVVVVASARPDRQDHPGVIAARIALDPRVEDPPSGAALVRPGLDLTPRDEAGIAISEIIGAWRVAERELAELVEGDQRTVLLESRIRGLRDLHPRLFAARVRPESISSGNGRVSRTAEAGEWLSRSARPMAG